MRASTIFTGFFGGLALALALAAPLYVGLPARYLPEWAYMTVEGSMWGFLLALVAVVGTGFVAAMLDPESPVSAGTLAGTLAAAVGAIVMVLPATALESVSDVLSTVESGADARVEELVARAMVSAAWLPSVVGLLVVGAGPAFGAMGGVGWDLTQKSPPPSSSRPGTFTVIPMAGLLAAVVWTAAVALSLRFVGTTFTEAELVLSELDAHKLAVPLAVLALSVGALLCWAIRDALLLYRDARRLRGATWGAASLGLSLVILTEAVVLYPASLTAPLLWGAVGVAGLAALVTFWRFARADLYMNHAGTPLGGLFAQALIGGLAVVGPGLFGGGAAIIAVGTVGLPWLAAVTSGTEPVASELMAQRVFQQHWLAGGALVALAVMGVVAVAPIWLYQQRRAR